MILRLTLFALTLLFSEQLKAEIIYSNTAVDTGLTINLLDAGGQPFLEFGDQIAFDGTERAAQIASAQLFRATGEGHFDVTLRLYNVGTTVDSPVGTQIGSSFTLQNLFVASTDTVSDIDFSLNGLVLPDNVVFTLSLSNLTAGLSFGVSYFKDPVLDGPTTGRSDKSYIITKSTNLLTGQPVFSQTASNGNLFFSVSTTATSVPEPLTLPIIAIGVAATALAKRRRISAA